MVQMASDRTTLASVLSPDTTALAQTSQGIGTTITTGRGITVISTLQRGKAVIWVYADFRQSSVAVWHTRPNPYAGIRELQWYQEHKAGLEKYRNEWIAILGESIIASGPTFEEVYKEVTGRKIYDALILSVPDPINKWDNLIA